MNSDIRMVEIATGHVSNRSQVAMLSELSEYVFPIESKTETYHSWYVFDEQLDQHIKATGSIQGYNGVYYIENIILDYDKKELSNQDLYNGVKFLVNTEMINDLGIDPWNIIIWYSGTGFHIEIPDLFGFEPSTSLPSIVRETLTNVFPECDSIYDGARLIRGNFAYNAKRDKFKIPFEVDVFNELTMDEIIKQAIGCSGLLMWEDIEERYISWHEEGETHLNEYIKYPNAPERTQNTVRSEFKIDPNNVVTCMQSVLAMPPKPGERNDTMMRIGSWMRRSGIPEKVVEHTLTQWSGLEKEAKRCTQRVFDERYEYSCQDYIMSKNCKPNCIYFKHKDYNLNIMNPEDLENDYEEFMSKDFTNVAFNFADMYEMKADFWVFPGELVVVTGNTGLGKSTWVMNLVTSLTKMNVLFLSLENSKYLTFRRFAQMTWQLDKNTIMNTKRKPSEGQLDLEYDPIVKYAEKFKHIHILYESPELSKLQETIARMKPQIVVVDTTDMVFVKGVHDELSKMNYIINGLKATAQNQDCIIIAVHHVNKQAMHDGVTTLTSLKGSTNVVQKADKVLALNGENNEDIRSIHSEKARDDGAMKLMFKFDKITMTFNQIVNPTGFN